MIVNKGLELDICDNEICKGEIVNGGIDMEGMLPELFELIIWRVNDRSVNMLSCASKSKD